MAWVRLEVRCCCQPKKLLGWLTVPDARCLSVSFCIPQRLLARTAKPVIVKLSLDQINCEIDGELVSYRAIKAEGAPLKLLRKIPGFEEA